MKKGEDKIMNNFRTILLISIFSMNDAVYEFLKCVVEQLEEGSTSAGI